LVRRKGQNETVGESTIDGVLEGGTNGPLIRNICGVFLEREKSWNREDLLRNVGGRGGAGGA